jgi:opacity protein-like surface antigen
MNRGFVRVAVLAFSISFVSSSVRAQSNDIGVTTGGYFAMSPLNLGAAWALEGTFAHQIASLSLVSISAELPVAGSFSSPIPTLSGATLARSYSSLFITPGLRLMLTPFPLSPYLSAGIGYARFNRQLFNGTSSSTGTLAFDVGGGLELKVAPFMSVRGELRNFSSGGLGLPTLIVGRQNNLFATVGLAVRF